MCYLLMAIIIPFLIFAQIEIEKPVSIASQNFKNAHRFHGIKYSKWEDGEWVFYRNGKKCKLFNDKIPKINNK